MYFNKSGHNSLDHGKKMSWSNATEGQMWQSEQEGNMTVKKRAVPVRLNCYTKGIKMTETQSYSPAHPSFL